MNMEDPAVSEQIPINQAIIEHLTDLLPPAWQAIELRLEFGHTDPPDVSLHVTNPDSGEIGPTSPELSAAANDLAVHRRKHQLKWGTATFTARVTETRDWKVSATFR